MLLPGLDLANFTGIEVGPLDRPIVRRSDGRIIYVDRATTTELREKYANQANVDIENIVPTDVVWGDAALPDQVGRQSADYVIASHVAEHVPDLITWLQEMQATLKPHGQLRLVLPDKRVSSDYLREETRLVDFLDAYIHRARNPRARQILDYALYAAKNIDFMAVYRGELRPSDVIRMHTWDSALTLARDALQNDRHVDLHCWVFTPRSFAELMATLVGHDLLRLGCAGFIDSSFDLFEFYVFLRQYDDKTSAVASWRHMQQTANVDLPGSAAEATRQREAQNARDAEHLAAELERKRCEVERLAQEKQIILNSTIWRATAPLRLAGRSIPETVRRWLHERP